MGFNDWIKIDPVSVGPEERFEEVDSLAKDKLAGSIESRLRGRINPGLDADSARRSQSIRSYADGGHIVIDSDDPGAVLTGGHQREGSQPSAKARGVEDLFELGSGVPEFVDGSDGQRILAYRTIDYDKLFGDIQQGEQDQAVKRTVTETLRMGIVDAFDDAVEDVKRRTPDED